MSKINKMIDHVMLSEPPKYRPYLGMSQIGNPDERMLWLNFRWCLPPNKFEPRVSRILELGNVIEDVVVDYLKKADGVEVFTEDKKGDQFKASLLGDHFSGHIDGVVKNLPEHDDDSMVLEVKSSNDRRFNNLVSEGSYERWSLEYEAQVHCYMGSFKLPKSLALVYNKNNSDIYTEVIKYNHDLFVSLIEKAKRIITSPEPPDLFLSENDWKVKNLPKESREVYLGRAEPEFKNCRNCKHSKPMIEVSGATWRCGKKGVLLNPKQQMDKKNCPDHELIFGLIPTPF